MKHESKQVTISGVVTGVFAHRFVIEGDAGKFLADLGPEGVHRIDIREGEAVTIHGERKPSEIKVWDIAKAGHDPVRIDRPHKHDHHRHPHHHDNVSSDSAISAVRQAGYSIVHLPRRKPKHFEILGRAADGTHTEFHVEFDGHIRKSKHAEPDDPKWNH